MILGVDVGQKNIGVCVLSASDGGSEPVIQRWAVWSADGSRAADLHACLDREATPAFLETVRAVVIERQPAKNPTMTRIMHYLEFYFASKGLPVTLQDAKRKLAHAACTPWFPREIATDAEWTYARRKKLAVQTTAAFLDATQPQHENARALFAGSKKKDDLADALWHAAAFAAFSPATAAGAAAGAAAGNEKKSQPPKKVVARCPSAKQSASGRLSPSNVKYLLRDAATRDVQGIDAALRGDARLRRCLVRHFKNVEGFLARCG